MRINELLATNIHRLSFIVYPGAWGEGNGGSRAIDLC
jgi:hypothetical protein